MTILVTGATGTVGRHVVEELVRRGESVRALAGEQAPWARMRKPAHIERWSSDSTAMTYFEECG